MEYDFNTVSKHLLLRYPPGENSFSFRDIRRDASDEGLMGLANAIASVQSPRPVGVYVVDTHRITAQR